MLTESYGTPPGSMSPSSACSSDNGNASDLDDFLLGPDGGSLFEGFETTREALQAVDEAAPPSGPALGAALSLSFKALPASSGMGAGVGVGVNAMFPAAANAAHSPTAEDAAQAARELAAQLERERRARQQTAAARMARRRSTGSAGYTRETRLPAPHAIDKSGRHAWKAETERILSETRAKLESYARYRRLLDDAHDWDGSGNGAASRKRRREEYEASHASDGSDGSGSEASFDGSGMAPPRAKRSAMTAKQRLQARKDRKNKREKQRRSDVNVMFMTLIDMLGLRPDIKSDKVTILSGAVNHINALRAQNEALLARVRSGAGAAGAQLQTC